MVKKTPFLPSWSSHSLTDANGGTGGTSGMFRDLLRPNPLGPEAVAEKRQSLPSGACRLLDKTV